MNKHTDELVEISQRTLAHYEARAQQFWEGTRDHDVLQNINALLDHIDATPPFTILDFGCGPGRDLLAFKARGHIAIGLDGTAAFVEMAQTLSGCEAWHQDFMALALPEAKFDGIFANASLQHVPLAILADVLRALRECLKPGGVLFASIPRGDDQEGWSNGRFSRYHQPDSWRAHCSDAGFSELKAFYRPHGLPCAEQPWFASVWRR